jgi:hypothetical protein
VPRAIQDSIQLGSISLFLVALLKFNVPIATFEVILVIRFWTSCEGEGSGLWGGISFPLNLSCDFLQPPHRRCVLLSPKGGRQTSPELSFILLFFFFQLSLGEHLH